DLDRLIVSESPHQLPRPLEGELGFLLPPMRAGPAEPCAKMMVEQQLIAVLGGERECGRVLGHHDCLFRCFGGREQAAYVNGAMSPPRLAVAAVVRLVVFAHDLFASRRRISRLKIDLTMVATSLACRGGRQRARLSASIK